MSDNTLFRVADLIVGRPLLVTPAKAEVVLYALQNRLNLADADRPTPDAAARFMARRDRDKNSPTINGMAVVRIVGSLANRYSFENSCAGIQSYEQISMGVRAAMEDPDVHSILLDIDSPGGEATGMFRLAHLIREARKTKRVVAFVDDMAASAAYGIASQAHEIVVSPTSIVGSIGVVLVHLDRSAELEQHGVKPTLIHAGAHKVDGNSFGPLSSEVRADLQAEVLAFYEQFVATVAMGRPGLSPDAIKATEARTFIGEESIKRGLADRVASIDEVLSDLRVNSALKARANTGKLRMDTNTPAPEAAATFTQADLGGARTAGVAEGRAAGATAERERISAIMNAEAAKGREAAALKLALNAGALPAEVAIEALEALPAVSAEAPKAPAATLEDRMAANPLGLMTDGQAPAADAPSRTAGLRAAIDALQRR